jgi:4-carboxymuconolactone decarboxylase
MPTGEGSLGGRLPLLDRESLTPAQQDVFDRITMTAVPWARRAGFQASTGTGQLIGPFNPALLNPAISATFLRLQLDEAEHTSVPERTRQVIILTVGAVWRTPYELYAHSTVARHAGLPEDVIQALAAGAHPDGLAGDEELAHRVARALSVEHRLSGPLYREAEDAFGAAGISDIVSLTGIYHTVCALLNAFEIPAP